MQKILVFGSRQDGAPEVRQMIERELPYQIFEASNEDDLKAQIEQLVFSAVVVVKSNLENDDLFLIDRLRNAHYSFSIVVITDTSSSETVQKVKYMSDVHTLVRPVTNRNVVGLVRKLLVAKRVPKQVFRRFNKNQIAQIESLDDGDNLLTSMYNLSKGGAYCEFESNSLLAVGDVVRLKIFLSDTNSEYTFNAKVIWTTATGRFSGRFGCGFRFIAAKDIHRSLLSKS